ASVDVICSKLTLSGLSPWARIPHQEVASMKKSRLAITAALSASVLAGSMLLAAPALAADVYVPDTTKGVEGDSYPAGWFTGNPQPDVAPVDDETGITLTGKTQFLY